LSDPVVWIADSHQLHGTTQHPDASIHLAGNNRVVITGFNTLKITDYERKGRTRKKQPVKGSC
jgi:hypothetical protein